MNQVEQNKIIVDHAKADQYGDEWIVSMNNELFARGLLLNSAMNKFNKFLDLPEETNNHGAIWDLAFGILSTAIPALRLTKFIGDVKTNSEKALALAKSAQTTVKTKDAAKYLAARGAQGAGKAAQKIDDAKKKVEDIKEAYEKATEQPDSGTSQLSKLDAARGPIKNLIEDGRNAEDSWKTASSAELAEFENRLNEIKSSVTMSLEAYIKDKLKPVPRFTEDELTEIETLFLWEMIASYAKQNLKVTETRSVYYGQQTGSSSKVEGFNNTQWTTILNLFGPGAKRGKIFYKSMLLPVQGYTHKYVELIGGVSNREVKVNQIRDRGNRI